jgi:hypothetical protein
MAGRFDTIDDYIASQPEDEIARYRAPKGALRFRLGEPVPHDLVSEGRRVPRVPAAEQRCLGVRWSGLAP